MPSRSLTESEMHDDADRYRATESTVFDGSRYGLRPAPPPVQHPEWGSMEVFNGSRFDGFFGTRRRNEPKPVPESGVVHGVSLATDGGAIATSEMRGEQRTATKLRHFGPGLEPIAAAVRDLLADDPGYRVVLDRGMRGRELADAIGRVEPRRRLQVFDARLEERRYEIGGRLSHAIEAKLVRITRNLLAAPALRRAVSDASREDAAEKPTVVALSLSLIERRKPLPRIG